MSIEAALSNKYSLHLTSTDAEMGTRKVKQLSKDTQQGSGEAGAWPGTRSLGSCAVMLPCGLWKPVPGEQAPTEWFGLVLPWEQVAP